MPTLIPSMTMIALSVSMHRAMISAPERDSLHQQVALHVHDEERRHDREEQHHADDQPGLAAHGEEQHDEDDADRLDQVEHELVGGRGDRLGLEVDLADLDADRLVRLQLVERSPDALAHRHDVAALHGGDAQADGRLAVVAEQTARRVLIAALDRRHVAEEELPARLVGADDQLEHVLGRAESALGIERDVLVADAHAAAVGGDVSRLQLGVDLLLVDAELRQPLPRDFEEDDFLLLGEELDAS